MADTVQRIEARRSGPAYGEDYAAWIEHQRHLMRENRLAELDLENLIDEVGDLAQLQRAELTDALEMVLTAMLKWDTDEREQTRGAACDIGLARLRIEEIFRNSPSLLDHVDSAVGNAYRFARYQTSGDLDLPLKQLPSTSPYGWDGVMHRAFPIDGDGE